MPLPFSACFPALPGRTMANLQNLLNQRILKRFAHVKVVMTLNTPVDCEFGTRRVEIKPLSDMESVILFSKLYHAGLTVSALFLS